MSAATVRINLLPHREEKRKQRKQSFFIALAFCALIGAAIGRSSASTSPGEGGAGGSGIGVPRLAGRAPRLSRSAATAAPVA